MSRDLTISEIQRLHDAHVSLNEAIGTAAAKEIMKFPPEVREIIVDELDATLGLRGCITYSQIIHLLRAH